MPTHTLWSRAAGMSELGISTMFPLSCTHTGRSHVLIFSSACVGAVAAAIVTAIASSRIQRIVRFDLVIFFMS